MRLMNDNIEFLKLRLQSNPNSFLFARLVDELLKMGDINSAIPICENGLKRHPYYVTGHFVMGKCYFKKKLYDQAEKEFKRVLFFDPKFLAAHKYYAELMKQIGWESAAESCYVRILQIDPHDLEIRDKLEALNSSKNREPIADVPDFEFMPEKEEIAPEKIAQDFIETEPKVKSRTLASDVDTQQSLPPQPAAPSEPKETPESDIFEAVIEDEPLKAEDEEKFSYILDEIFREDNAVEDSKPQATEPPDDFDFFGNFDEDTSTPPSNVVMNTDELETIETKEIEFEKNSEIEPELPEEEPQTTALDFEDLADMFADKSEPVETPLNFDRRSSPLTPPPQMEEMDSLEDLARDIKSNASSEKNRQQANFKSPPSGQEIRPKVPPTPKVAPPSADIEEQTTEFTEKKRKEKIVTPTLGEIYAAQGQYAKAIGVFEILRKKEPNNPAYIDKIRYLKKNLEESQKQ
ncbi:tetratricopeptide repeat protein [candidate division KSB1 bacterium]|nr:tetratricopeptide repeat protein [candidate division KSB1 bacterium]